MPEMSLAMVIASERLICSVPLSTTLALPIVPIVLPAPMLRMPAEMVVRPL